MKVPTALSFASRPPLECARLDMGGNPDSELGTFGVPCFRGLPPVFRASPTQGRERHWRVRDLNSANGIKVISIAIQGDHELAFNDKLSFPGNDFLFVEDASRLPDLPRPEDRSEGATVSKESEEDNQPSRTTVETLQLEFVKWLRRYQPTLRRVPFGSDRLKDSPRQIPAAEWFGAMAKCCYFVETLVAACLKQLLPIAGTRGVEMVEKVGDGKPLDLLTLGQRVTILCALDKSISPAFWRLCPELHFLRKPNNRQWGPG